MDHRFQPRGYKSDFGWYNGKHLPHLDGEEFTQFVTIRLYDSMPQTLLDEWRNTMPSEAAFRKRVEKYLDAGYGECWLKQREIAEVVKEALTHHNGKNIDLHGWVVMPNHAHYLYTPFIGCHIDKLHHSIKSYTAHESNKLLNRSGQFWQHESFDRYIRNVRHFDATVKYIHMNPVKAGLCKDISDWEFSSARR